MIFKNPDRIFFNAAGFLSPTKIPIGIFLTLSGVFSVLWFLFDEYILTDFCV